MTGRFDIHAGFKRQFTHTQASIFQHCEIHFGAAHLAFAPFQSIGCSGFE